MVRTLTVVTAAALLGVTFACGGGDEPHNPASPSVGPRAGIDAAADGSTLKVTAPEPVFPVNGAELQEFEVVLQVNPSVPKFTTGVDLTYRFQLLEGTQVVRQSSSTPSRTWRLTALDNDKTYGWRARAEMGSAFGPWSAIQTFRTPDQPEGYSIPGELYDPLLNGESVGDIIGSTTFIPGKGIRLNNQLARIKYVLKRTVKSGEFSMIISGLRTNTEGGKTKIMSMAEGDADITTNNRRMTVEKRGNPPGIIAWRFISYLDIVDTVGAERVKREFDPNKDYFWVASWRNQRFTVRIYEGGPGGRLIYSFGKPYHGPYDPNPHHAWAGGPPGRVGPDSGSVDGMIVRQVYLGERPRPAFANK
ncbi:MAG TPA: hypothetical protein VNK41_04625 [Vicinamibacterales bacterium]|nr:hypothetical protein [Vicinamibacterales bacterium]